MNPTTDQVELIQKHLDKVYEAFQLQEVSFSYKSLAACIEEHWEQLTSEEWSLIPAECRSKKIELQKGDNFRKFVKEESHTMQPPEKLWACFLWLASDDCEYSSLTAADITGEEYSLKLAQLMERFLYDRNQVETWLTAESFNHRYQYSNERSTFHLSFLGTRGSNILQASQQEERYVAHDISFVRYSGFLLFSPEDHGILLLRNIDELYSSMYSLLPGHEIEERGQRIDSFSLINLEGAQLDQAVASLLKLGEGMEDENVSGLMTPNFPLYKRDF